MTQEAGKSKPANVTNWEYCPECGKIEIHNRDFLGAGSRQCSNCGQEWWLDIDYSDIVRKNLTRLFAAAQQIEQPWVRVEDGYPKSKSDVIFIVRGSRDYDGRILGGRYTGYDDEPNEFSTPGMGYCASHWKYSPPAPPKQ